MDDDVPLPDLAAENRLRQNKEVSGYTLRHCELEVLVNYWARGVIACGGIFGSQALPESRLEELSKLMEPREFLRALEDVGDESGAPGGGGQRFLKIHPPPGGLPRKRLIKRLVRKWTGGRRDVLTRQFGDERTRRKWPI